MTELLAKASETNLGKSVVGESLGLKAPLSLKLGDTIKVIEGDTNLEARRLGVDHEDEPAAWDVVTGEPLDRGELLKTRASELEHIRNKKF